MFARFHGAVVMGAGQRPSIERIAASHLGANDVFVRVVASGLCQSDIELMDGTLRGSPFPCVIGHEAAGVVEAIGEDVRSVAIGDHVVCSWNPRCGTCWYCRRGLPILCEVFTVQRARGSLMEGETRLVLNGKNLYHFSCVSAHAEYALVSERSAISIPHEMPLDRACMIGCGVAMGVGAVTHVCPVEVGSNVAVVGCSIDGLNVIQAARIVGASSIIAIGRDPGQLESARLLGASLALLADPETTITQVRDATEGRGADYVFEVDGSELGFRLAAEIARPGAHVVFLGKVDIDAEVRFRWGSLTKEKQFIRTSNGGANPEELFPWIAARYLDGSLKLDELVESRIKLENIQEGYDGMRNGNRLRTIVAR